MLIKENSISCTIRRIAAGVVKEEPEDQRYGDVIVPDVIRNYSAGKFVSPEQAEIRYGNMGFLPRSTFEQIPEKILPMD